MVKLPCLRDRFLKTTTFHSSQRLVMYVIRLAVCSTAHPHQQLPSSICNVSSQTDGSDKQSMPILKLTCYSITYFRTQSNTSTGSDGCTSAQWTEPGKHFESTIAKPSPNSCSQSVQKWVRPAYDFLCFFDNCQSCTMHVEAEFFIEEQPFLVYLENRPMLF